MSTGNEIHANVVWCRQNVPEVSMQNAAGRQVTSAVFSATLADASGLISLTLWRQDTKQMGRKLARAFAEWKHRDGASGYPAVVLRKFKVVIVKGSSQMRTLQSGPGAALDVVAPTPVKGFDQRPPCLKGTQTWTVLRSQTGCQ